MNGDYLVDTNAVSDALEGNEAILELLKQPSKVYISSIWYMVENSGRKEENRKRLEAFMSGRTILKRDADTTKVYANIRYQLKIKGRPIPENDVWLAAVAKQYNLTLLTRDAHFKVIDGLLLTSW
jgi:tRNA(fMet)-specific endonuclease VapC